MTITTERPRVLALRRHELRPEELVFAQRVRAGIALLDDCERHVHRRSGLLRRERCAFENWRERLGLGRLDISLNHDCVLGQLIGSFTDYPKVLDTGRMKAREFGFITCSDAVECSCPDTQAVLSLPRWRGSSPSALLTATWRHVLLPDA